MTQEPREIKIKPVMRLWSIDMGGEIAYFGTKAEALRCYGDYCRILRPLDNMLTCKKCGIYVETL